MQELIEVTINENGDLLVKGAIGSTGSSIIEISLRAARELRGFTLKEVSEALNRSEVAIAEYEEDSSEIPCRLFAELSDLYQIPMDYIFIGDEKDLFCSMFRIRNRLNPKFKLHS